MKKENLPYIYALISVLTFTLFLQVNKIEPFESFALRFNDLNFNLQKKTPNKDIVFVAVDEKSVNRFGRWPWRRDIIAKGVTQLQEANLLLLDMIFSEPTTLEADDALAEAISYHNATICGFFLRHHSTQQIPDTLLDVLDDSSLDLLQSEISHYKNPLFISAPFAEVNIEPILQSCTLSGSFSTLASSDELFRSYPIALYFNNKLFPSLAIQALRLKFDKDINRVNEHEVMLNNKKINLDEKGFVRLNFYKREQYKIISFLDLIEGKITPEYFQGKIVLLGITEVGAGDVVSTPIGALYGPLMHYTFLSNFLENHLIIETPYINSILVVFIILMPFLLLLFIKKTFIRVFTSISIFLTLYILTKYLFIYYMLYIDLFYSLLGLTISLIFVEVIAFNKQEKSAKFLKEAFSAYLSPSLLEELIQHPEALTLGGEKKELSVLFSDIRGFTTITETLNDAHALVHLLNRYFTPMTESVLKYNGMLDKYIGDAVMAFYNAPIDVKAHADQACFTALDMIQRLEKLNTELKNDPQIDNEILPIKIGIGINTAELVVGNIGSDAKFNYTVMGDGVNLTSRVEGLTKNYAVDILITEFTLKQLKSEFIYRKIEPVVVKGKEEAVLLYELMPTTKDAKEIKKLYDKALEVYIAGDLKKAEQLFSQLLHNYDDGLSRYFLKNIQKRKVWGTCIMQTK